MSRLFWLLVYICISSVCSKPTIRGIIRYTPIVHPLSSKTRRQAHLYVPPTITPEEEPMDHGELPWDIIDNNKEAPSIVSEKEETHTVVQNTSSTSTTAPNMYYPHVVSLYLRMIELFTYGLPTTYDSTDFRYDLENPVQIVFLFI